MPNYTPIPGTFTYGKLGWHSHNSWFARRMEKHGLFAEPAFPWSGVLDGIVGEDETWGATGEQLALHLERIPLYRRNLIGHSNAGQPIIEAMARRRVQLNKVVLFGTPVRKRQSVLLASAIRDGLIDPNHFWLIYARGGFWNDWTQWMGQWFDGDWSNRRWYNVPGVQNIPGPEYINHSEALNGDPAFTDAVEKTGVIEFLRSERDKPSLLRRMAIR